MWIRGVAEDARLLIDGRGLKVPGHENGFFIGGSLFDHVTPEMSICRVDNFKDAVELINHHEFGNGTALFTRDGKAAREFAQHIQVGMVGINVPVPVPMAFHSFGGWKRSLFGPVHMHGPDGVRFYTRMKMITSRWNEHDASQSVFSMPTMKWFYLPCQLPAREAGNTHLSFASHQNSAYIIQMRGGTCLWKIFMKRTITAG